MTLKLRRLSGIILLVLISMSIGGIAHAFDYATELELDSSYDADLNPGGDYDDYKFNVTPGYYAFETFGDVDTVIELYDTDGETLIAYDDDSGEDWNALIFWQCTTPGMYYLQVSGYDEYVTGEYSIAWLNATEDTTATITGYLTYNNEPFTHENTTIDLYSPDWHSLDAFYDSQTGMFTANTSLHGDYYVDVFVDAAWPYGTGLGYSGDYLGGMQIYVPIGATEIHENISVSRIIHLVSPADNDFEIGPGVDVKTELGQDDLIFEWERFPEDSQYWVQIALANLSHGWIESVDYMNLWNNSVILDLPINDVGEYYRFYLLAYNDQEEEIGILLTAYNNGHTYGYDFVVVEPSAGIIVTTNQASYLADEIVIISGTAEVDALVAIAVKSPTDTSTYLDSVQADDLGAYSTMFRLPVDAMTGTYTVYASTTGATASTTFIVGPPGLPAEISNEQTLDSTRTPKTSFTPGETVLISAEVSNVGVVSQPMFIVIQLQDPELRVMAPVFLIIELDPGDDLTYAPGLIIPTTGYATGTWTATIMVLTTWPAQGGYPIAEPATITFTVSETITNPIIVAQIKGALADTQLTAIMDNINFVDWLLVTGDISSSDLQDAMMLITVLADSFETYTAGEIAAINSWLDEGSKAIWICGDSDYGNDALRIDVANSLLEDIGSVLRIDHASVEDPVSNGGAPYEVLSITDNVSPDIEFIVEGVDRALTHGPGVLTAYEDGRYWKLEDEQPEGVYVILTSSEAGIIVDHTLPEPESVSAGDEGSFVTMAMEFNITNGNFFIVESEAPFSSFLGMYYPEMLRPDRYGPDANPQQGGRLFENIIDFFFSIASN